MKRKAARKKPKKPPRASKGKYDPRTGSYSFVDYDFARMSPIERARTVLELVRTDGTRLLIFQGAWSAANELLRITGRGDLVLQIVQALRELNVQILAQDRRLRRQFSEPEARGKEISRKLGDKRARVIEAANRMLAAEPGLPPGALRARLRSQFPKVDRTTIWRAVKKTLQL